MPDVPNLRRGAPDPGDDFLWQHLKALPAFRALLRAVEARFYQDLLPLAEPVLDVGCGDGHFASVAFPHPLTAGVDPESAVLGEAKERGAYRVLARALGNGLPYADGHFATVVSNSVLEHIPGVDAVLVEIARVLQPGGRFICCVPGDQFAEQRSLRTRSGLPKGVAPWERRRARVRQAVGGSQRPWMGLMSSRFRKQRKVRTAMPTSAGGAAGGGAGAGRAVIATSRSGLRAVLTSSGSTTVHRGRLLLPWLMVKTRPW